MPNQAGPTGGTPAPQGGEPCAVHGAAGAVHGAAVAAPRHGPGHSSSFVSDDHPVHAIPMRVVQRPLMPSVDEVKVQEFMGTVRSGASLTPIDVLWVERPEGNYYFSFGGCHRWEAHSRLGSATIDAKLVRTPASSIALYLGASSPFK